MRTPGTMGKYIMYTVYYLSWKFCSTCNFDIRVNGKKNPKLCDILKTDDRRAKQMKNWDTRS